MIVHYYVFILIKIEKEWVENVTHLKIVQYYHYFN